MNRYSYSIKPEFPWKLSKLGDIHPTCCYFVSSNVTEHEQISWFQHMALLNEWPIMNEYIICQELCIYLQCYNSELVLSLKVLSKYDHSFFCLYIYRLVSPVLVRTKGVYSDILYFYISTNPTNPTQINNECVLLTRIVCVSTAWQIVFLGVIELHCSKTIKNTSMSNTAGDMTLTHWLNPTYSTLSCSPKYH